MTLELGGKSPQLVFADAADLDIVAGHVARGFLGNAGQVCTAGSRLIVQKGLLTGCWRRSRSIARPSLPGLTWKEATSFSPIVSARQADRLEELVRRTLAEGASLRRGGRRLETQNQGSFYARNDSKGSARR